MKQTVNPKLFSEWPRIAVRWTVVVVWLLLFFGGLITINSPNRQLPIAAGWILLSVAAAALVTTITHWVHLLPLLFGYGALNGLISTFNGSVGSDAPNPISRGQAGVITACFIICALLTARFRRPVTIADRLGLLGAFVAVVFGTSREQASLAASVLMLSSVLAAFVFDSLSAKLPRRSAPL